MYELAFDPPEASPRIAVVTIDRPGRSVNTFAPDQIPEVNGVFDAIEGESGIAGVILISGKPGNFVAGADVEVFARAEDRREIESFGRRGHELLSRMAGFRLPVVVAVDGACLGAGFEMMVAAHYRICTSHPKTVLGLPEVKLGLFPGGGGVTRLPRLIGVREALDLILTGRNVYPRQAKKMGLVDEVVAPEALMIAARDAVAGLVSGRLKRRTGPAMDVTRRALEGNPLGRRVLFHQARRTVERKTLGLYPAPLVALDLVEKGLKRPIDEALAAEPPAFAELAVGEVSRSLVSLFRHSNALKSQPVPGATEPVMAVDRLGLLGGGFMGGDIAIVAAQSGIDTRIREVAAAPLAGALGHVDRYFARRAKRAGAASVYKARARISGALDLAGFETMDLVIEAVPEVLALKQDVFADLENQAGEHTVLATNTSALPLGDIGRKLRDKSRFIGLHFFSPVPKMPLLEIVRTEQTSAQTLAVCLAFATRIGKTPIVVRDGPGFYTTRVLGFYLQAAVAMLREGHSIEAIDRGARLSGWPVGPLSLLDEVGIDVGAKVSKTLAQYYPKRLHSDEAVDRFVSDGRLGRKSKRGFYLYPAKGRKKPDPTVYEMLGPRPTAPARTSPEELGERLTLIAAMEAVRCLHEGVIASERDGDVGAVFGFGYPPLRGGPFRHLRTRGLETVLGRLAAFCDRFGDVYQPPRVLEELVRSGKDLASMQGAA